MAMVLWEPIKISEQLFIVKFVHNLNKVSCHLSNFERVWSEALDVPLVLERAKNENQSVEYSEKTIIDTILSPAKEYKLNQEVSSENKTVFRLKYYVSSVPFLFYWNMVQCSTEIFFQEITRTLLVSLVDSQRKNVELVDVIRRKDVHIDQYQAEGAILLRKQVATAAFNHDEFTQKYAIENMDESFIRLCEPNSCKDIQSLCKFIIKDTLAVKSTINIEGSLAGSSNHVYKSPDKIAAKRLKKDSIALRKFQPKTDAKFAYDQIVDEDDEETTAHVIVPESHPTPNAEFSEPTSNEKIQNPLNKEIKAATHKRKFRKDLNL